MTGQVHTLTHRVTYAECTMGNHIYYGRYLELLEAARGEFLRGLDHPLLALQAAECIFPVVECRLQYHHPARYDDLLTIETWVGELGRVRLGFCHRVVASDGRVVLTAETRHACTDLAEKPRRIPAPLSARLEDWRHDAEGAGHKDVQDPG